MAQLGAAAVPQGGRVGLADAVDDEHGGVGEGRDQEGAGGVAVVVLAGEHARARDTCRFGQVIEDPDLAAELAGEGAGEQPPGAGEVAQEVDHHRSSLAKGSS
jgi:hypothetical protein